MVLRPKTLTHPAWVDDLRLYSDSLEILNAMLKDVAEAVYKDVWLTIRWEQTHARTSERQRPTALNPSGSDSHSGGWSSLRIGLAREHSARQC